MEDTGVSVPVKLPRIAIVFCTGCRWMLRAAYFGQELFSTFGNSIGEIALIPATGGVFTITLTYRPVSDEKDDALEQEVAEVLLWSYKTEKCFPETKILKQMVRDRIDPSKKLGHSDKPSTRPTARPDPTSGHAGDVKESIEEDKSNPQKSDEVDSRVDSCLDCK